MLRTRIMAVALFGTALSLPALVGCAPLGWTALLGCGRLPGLRGGGQPGSSKSECSEAQDGFHLLLRSFWFSEVA